MNLGGMTLSKDGINKIEICCVACQSIMQDRFTVIEYYMEAKFAVIGLCNPYLIVGMPTHSYVLYAHGIYGFTLH